MFTVRKKSGLIGTSLSESMRDRLLTLGFKETENGYSIPLEQLIEKKELELV